MYISMQPKDQDIMPQTTQDKSKFSNRNDSQGRIQRV